EPKDGERGRKIGRFAPTARYASLTMTYAAAPKGPNMAVQWEKENRLIHPKKVVLVGEGLNLRTELALDVPATDFQTDAPNAKPPYFIVGWLDPNDNRNALKDSSVYLSDRQYRASLVQARDDGRITIESKVEDLSRDWQSLAIRRDQRATLQVKLVRGRQRASAEVDLTLDSTPPRAQLVIGPGTEISKTKRIAKFDLSVRGSDTDRRGRDGSGARWLIYGIDETGDGRPEQGRELAPEDIRDGVWRRRGLKVGGIESRHDIAARVVDRAGWLSEPSAEQMDVRWTPDPRPTQPAASAGMAATKPAEKEAAKPPPPKRLPIFGAIKKGSTMRGTLTLSPVVPKMTPANGTLQIGSGTPTYNFGNLPDNQTYTLKFDGTVGGSRKAMTWEGLKPKRTKQDELPRK
ncbi:MAG: hypothetical protein AAF958_18555, partial [Planctomycetota bacterium]